MRKDYPYDVHVRPAKPNKMFTDWQTATTKFLRYRLPVACAHCGKKRKLHWTQLLFFRVMDPEGFTLLESPKLYPPLTPVCGDHILKPER